MNTLVEMNLLVSYQFVYLKLKLILLIVALFMFIFTRLMFK